MPGAFVAFGGEMVYNEKEQAAGSMARQWRLRCFLLSAPSNDSLSCAGNNNTRKDRASMERLRIAIPGLPEAKVVNYKNALGQLGAEVAVIHELCRAEDYDGLLLAGGADADPRLYGEENVASKGIDPARDQLEMAMMDAFVKAKKPVLGTCRGHQMINVFFGGSLYQHLPESALHRGAAILHEVKAAPDSIVGKLYGSSFTVNSTHHQAVKALGTGLRATAYWEDKYVEACEHTSLPVFSVQWHPEKMETGNILVEHFIKLCEKATKG
jgi:putative glutamine amidotransferase